MEKELKVITFKKVLQKPCKEYEAWIYGTASKSQVQKIQIFQSPWMERWLTRYPWWGVPLFWIPVISMLFYTGFAYHIENSGLFHGIFVSAGIAITGGFAWRLAELVLHKYLFHLKVDRKWKQVFHFLMHGIHHITPKVLTRLVMPPLTGIPIAIVIYCMLALYPFLILAPKYSVEIGFQLAISFANLFMGGLLTVYMKYDMVHYMIHRYSKKELLHFPFGAYLGKVKKQHMSHHYTDPTNNFAVSFLDD